jgi:hypothetical protein
MSQSPSADQSPSAESNPRPRTLARRLALCAALAACSVVSASAATPVPQKNAKVEIRLVRSSFGVDAVVYVRCAQALPLQGDVHLVANGRLVKIEPISTETQQAFRVRVAGSGEAVTSCATFVGQTMLADTNTVAAQAQDCDQQLARLGPVEARRPVTLGGLVTPMQGSGPR